MTDAWVLIPLFWIFCHYLCEAYIVTLEAEVECNCTHKEDDHVGTPDIN